jgi:hypothetical protein
LAEESFDYMLNKFLILGVVADFRVHGNRTKALTNNDIVLKKLSTVEMEEIIKSFIDLSFSFSHPSYKALRKEKYIVDIQLPDNNGEIWLFLPLLKDCLFEILFNIRKRFWSYQDDLDNGPLKIICALKNNGDLCVSNSHGNLVMSESRFQRLQVSLKNTNCAKGLPLIYMLSNVIYGRDSRLCFDQRNGGQFSVTFPAGTQYKRSN